MLEALRVMATSPRQLTNSVVFLFNGGEESLQDASHLFITQQPPEIEGTIRSVINLEACGTAGPEIVFQATSEEVGWLSQSTLGAVADCFATATTDDPRAR